MSPKNHSRIAARRQARAPIFAALGDQTRLALVAKLCRGQASSISKLTAGSKLTRQAITKHLRVLENAGIVRSVRAGVRTCSNSIPSPLKESRITSISFPSNGIRRCPG
jgi:DNA-binding transcriptional ArsR family regulator